jgi:hypothetical protein
MFRSAMIATAATLALSIAAVAPASAKVVTKVSVTDAFGDHFSKTKITGHNVFGDKITKTRTVFDPAGPRKVVKLQIAKTDAFGDKIVKTKVISKGF